MSLPPLGDHHHEFRRCMRLTGRNEDGSERICGQAATRHVIWWWENCPEGGDPDEHWDNAFACPDHWQEIERRGWTYAAAHPMNGACGMPGSRCYFEENTCRMDDDLPVAEPVRAVAQPVAASSTHRPCSADAERNEPNTPEEGR